MYKTFFKIRLEAIMAVPNLYIDAVTALARRIEGFFWLKNGIKHLKIVRNECDEWHHCQRSKNRKNFWQKQAI